MKKGTKPFSYFCKHKDEAIDLDSLTSGQNFDYPNINFIEWKFGDAEYYFYFLEGEDWRVSAFKTLVEARFETGHSRQLEWLEGHLLGYTNEQNREFLTQVFDPISHDLIPTGKY